MHSIKNYYFSCLSDITSWFCFESESKILRCALQAKYILVAADASSLVSQNARKVLVESMFRTILIIHYLPTYLN